MNRADTGAGAHSAPPARAAGLPASLSAAGHALIVLAQPGSLEDVRALGAPAEPGAGTPRTGDGAGAARSAPRSALNILGEVGFLDD